MAHNIDTSKGFPAFVSYQAEAWHGLGYISQEKLSRKEAEQRGGLDFTVEKLPNIHRIPAAPGSLSFLVEKVSEDSFFTFRTDTHGILGTRLGRDYHILQNHEGFDVVDEILASGLATIETAGVINEGRRVFILLKVDKSIFIGGKDEIKQYLLITNSHDGTMALTVMFTNVRVVCANTLAAALAGAQGAIKIRHTTNAAERLKEAAKVLNLTSKNTDINSANYNKMKETLISKQDLMDYFGNLFMNEKEIALLQKGNKMDEVISTRKQNIITGVADYANNGKGQAEALNGGLNMWFAYNAVTGYVTTKKYKNADDRANSILFGSGAKTIQDAGVLALSPEKIQPLHKIDFSQINLN